MTGQPLRTRYLHFVFQPNEEHELGASAMIRDGLFERCDVEETYGIHNIPGMAAGSFATRSGSVTASESLFDIVIEVEGGHAALPDMAAARPGCCILMGNGTEGAHARALHSADYDFNDGMLTIGSSFWVQLVEQRLAAPASAGV